MSNYNNILQVSIAPGTPWCIPIVAAHFKPPGQTSIVGKLWPSSQFSPIPVFLNTKILLGHSHAHSCIYCLWQLQCQRWVVVIETKSPEEPEIVAIWSFMEKKLLKLAIGWHTLLGTSLVVQWLRVHLPMQGTQLWILVGQLSLLATTIEPVHSGTANN